MEELQLIPFADPRLKKRPETFDFGDDNLNAEELSEQLFIGMRRFGGVGLSANQVGIDKCVFVVGGSGIKEKAIFNPALMDVSDEQVTLKEGCLSYPGLWLMIKRPVGAIFKYQDEKGEEVIEEFKGIPARIMLHEYDHMLGHNFTMRASSLKIQRALKQLDKKVKRYKQNGLLR
jgi:peptide deformylase